MVGRGLIAALAVAAGGCLFVPPPGEADDGEPDAGGARSDGAPRDGADPTDAATEPALITCPAAAAVPVLDGVDEVVWSSATPLHFAAAEAEHTADRHPMYTADASVDLRCLHDPGHLFFFVEVVDGLTVNTRPIQVDGPDAREDDAVVIFLHAAEGAAGVYDNGSHALLLPAQEGDASLTAIDVAPAPITPTGQVRTDLDGGTWRAEIALDRSAIAPALGDRLRFNLALIDDDGWSDLCRDAFALDRQPGIPCIECCPGEDWTGECVNYSVGEALAWCDTRVSDVLALE